MSLLLHRLGFFCLIVGLALAVHGASRAPNLVVIMTDDQGYEDVGFNGSPDLLTPQIDSIARHGVRFTDGYVAYSVCSPSRAAFLTGRYGQRYGYERNPRYQPDNPQSGLARTETTLADALKSVGYRTGVIGKWHLGAHPDLHPLRRGFDEFYGHLGGGHRYLPEELTLENPAEARSEAESYRTWLNRDYTPVRTRDYLTDELSQAAADFIDRHHAAPFFLFLAYNAPHAPLQATARHLERFSHIPNERRRTYAAMLGAVDDGVGRVLAQLRRHGLIDDTLIFFLSDNGGPTADNASSNKPLRGTKGSPWEGGIRVPFAAQWPGHIPAGLVYTQPVISMDIFATMAALVSPTLPPGRPLDGVNLLPFLTGTQTGAPHDAIFLRMFDRGSFAVRSGTYKLVIPAAGATAELYDLGRDVSESRNLAASLPEVVAELDRRRKAWASQLIDPVFEGLVTAPRRTPASPPAPLPASTRP
ncbi:MAG TPA: sulfatase-like hydrolase/transferase [Opitutaceae bacterium]|nr:sulfatase-like hydrolase/transferase [Opitutaceae bacterium]